MKKILTIILDGFGMREEEYGNAIKAANMECFNKLWEEYPHSLLNASEEYVGLLEGQFGNSEVGHSTIGAGRLLKQPLRVINDFFKNDDIYNNELIKKLLERKNKPIHIMGLCSDGNTHSSIEHIVELYKFLVKNGFLNIHFHLITDGRDTYEKSALKYINRITELIKENNVGDIASICGRYYAMDRNRNYDRTKRYYDLITRGVGIKSYDINKTINDLYDREITDEFLEPIIINENSCIRNGDTLFWINFRVDRAKQILSTFTDNEYDNFRVLNMEELEIYSFYKIDDNIPTNYLLTEDLPENTLGIYLSKLGLSQARVAETEKFPHVTYFFNGGYDTKIPKCDSYLIPSPDVKTYDLKPEMSAVPVTKKCIECMMQDYDFILLNFANPDMVGHTGNFDAAVNACIAVDVCLNKLIEVANENFYKVILLADHGNADIMFDENNNKVTTHTLSKVPFIILDKNVSLKKEGDLTMVAPTILEYMDIAKPEEMSQTDILLIK